MTYPGLGGQQPPPQNASPAGQLTPGITAGVPGQIVARRVIVEGAGAGIYLYQGVPALGTLVSSMTFQGTDGFGNATLTGPATYRQAGASLWLASSLAQGGLFFWTATSAAGPWFLSNQFTNNNGSSTGVWPQTGGASITTVAQVVAALEAMGLLTP